MWIDQARKPNAFGNSWRTTVPAGARTFRPLQLPWKYRLRARQPLPRAPSSPLHGTVGGLRVIQRANTGEGGLEDLG